MSTFVFFVYLAHKICKSPFYTFIEYIKYNIKEKCIRRVLFKETTFLYEP